ncbi:MAG: hypothetical protein ACYTBP_00450 [Planctomycetota bacterium]
MKTERSKMLGLGESFENTDNAVLGVDKSNNLLPDSRKIAVSSNSDNSDAGFVNDKAVAVIQNHSTKETDIALEIGKYIDQAVSTTQTAANVKDKITNAITNVKQHEQKETLPVSEDKKKSILQQLNEIAAKIKSFAEDKNKNSENLIIDVKGVDLKDLQLDPNSALERIKSEIEQIREFDGALIGVWELIEEVTSNMEFDRENIQGVEKKIHEVNKSLELGVFRLAKLREHAVNILSGKATVEVPESVKLSREIAKKLQEKLDQAHDALQSQAHVEPSRALQLIDQTIQQPDQNISQQSQQQQNKVYSDVTAKSQDILELLKKFQDVNSAEAVQNKRNPANRETPHVVQLAREVMERLRNNSEQLVTNNNNTEIPEFLKYLKELIKEITENLQNDTA